MAKHAPDATLDVLPAKVATATRQSVCSAQPANFAGIAAVQLASIAMTAGNGNGDYVIGDGDVSGRKCAVQAQNDVPISASGSGNHLVLDDGAAIVYITTCTPQTLTSGGTVNIPTWDVEVADPT